jgi:hypothetical protein
MTGFGIKMDSMSFYAATRLDLLLTTPVVCFMLAMGS